MSEQTHPKLSDCSHESILEELRKRESEGNSSAKNKRDLAEYDPKALQKELKRSEKLVYGVDDRQDLYQVTDRQIMTLADSVVSLIDVGSISDNSNGSSTILTVPFRISNNLCEGERFREQPTAPFCSGFLVAPDIIATAGHCVNQNNLARIRFVFGFRMINESEPNIIIPNNDIFRGIALIVREEISTGADFALVRLDRPVTGHTIVPVRRSGKIDDGEEVFVIGHPSGLPLKFANGAHVQDNSPSSFFVANLDTYGGNSGSPVFNENEGIVEGILVRGDTDFVNLNGCRVSNVCPTTGCRGEDVTRTTEFADSVPENSTLPPADVESRIGNLEQAVESIANDIKEIKDSLTR
ncbi:MAG: serine protease [Crocosphaera sp.]